MFQTATKSNTKLFHIPFFILNDLYGGLETFTGLGMFSGEKGGVVTEVVSGGRQARLH